MGSKPDFAKLERDARVFDRAISDARSGVRERQIHPDTGEEIHVSIIDAVGVVSLSTPSLGRFYRIKLDGARTDDGSFKTVD